MATPVAALPQINLVFVTVKGQTLTSIPVATKSAAQAIVDALNHKAVSGVRVSYFDATQGCEAIMYVAHEKTHQLVKPAEV